MRQRTVFGVNKASLECVFRFREAEKIIFHGTDPRVVYFFYDLNYLS